jgi:hypothetical protein
MSPRDQRTTHIYQRRIQNRAAEDYLRPVGLAKFQADGEVVMIPELFLLALAGSVPAFDVQNVCRGVGSLGMAANGGSGYETCVRDERTAEQHLQRTWTQIPAAARLKCVEEAQTIAPSYVELLTCLEMEPQNFIATFEPPQPLTGRSRPDQPVGAGLERE